MIRQTSVDAYNALKNSGSLRAKQWVVYNHLYHHGPLTANVVAEDLRRSGQVLNKPSVTPRFAELQAMGVIVPVGKQGRCILWDVTSASEVIKADRKLSRKQLLDLVGVYEEDQKNLHREMDARQREIDRLTGQVAELRAEIEALTPARKKS